MITVGFSTKKVDPEFVEYIKSTIGPKNIEIIPIENPGKYSLTEAYNMILEQSTNDIVVLMHDDIYFEKKGWGNKLIKHFNRNPEYGILGVAGSVFMPESGKWWEKKKMMRGIVNHEHEGRKWESKYSNSLGNKVEEVLLVDGLFIALDKTRIKKQFNEEVSGFHFYDVYFSYENYLEDVKIGVMYDIRITHKSIGMVNDEWNRHRQVFAEKFKDTLPSKVFESFNSKKRKILLGCLNFRYFTGSELSTFELAKGLHEMGHEVYVFSVLGGPLTEKAKKIGINVYDYDEPPGYIKGDGKTLVTINGKQQVMKDGSYYKVKEMNFDIIQTNHKPITERLLEAYKENDLIQIVRSTVLEIENPTIHDRVVQYIAISPKVKNYVLTNFDVSENKVEMIYNIVDIKRGKPDTSSPKYILLPATSNHLRMNMIMDLVEKTKEEGVELWCCGRDEINLYEKLVKEHNHVKYLGVIEDLSDLYENAYKVAGLIMGRVLIEGLKYNKPIIGYDIDENGNITHKDYDYRIDDIKLLDKEFILSQYIELYEKTLNYNNG